MRLTTSTSFVTPVKSDGTEQTESAAEFGPGTFTLEAGATYYYFLGGQDAAQIDAHCQWDASIILTSMTIETCSLPEKMASGYDSTPGTWIAQTPPTAYVPVVGAGATATSGVVAVAGGAQGGCAFALSENSARRVRLKVVVGGTGGEMRVATWGKE